MFLIGYALGQILCTQFWKQAYKPRNYVPWGITIGSYVFDVILIITLRLYLQRENARRDRALAATTIEGAADEKGPVHRHNKYEENFGYVEKVAADGAVVRQKVEKGLLDLTVSCSPFLLICSKLIVFVGPRKPCVPLCALRALVMVPSLQPFHSCTKAVGAGLKCSSLMLLSCLRRTVNPLVLISAFAFRLARSGPNSTLDFFYPNVNS